MSESYHETVKIRNTLKLRELLKDLPEFMGEFFRGIAETTSTRTRLGYAYDLKLFFTFIMELKKPDGVENVTQIDFRELSAIEPEDIEKFMEYLTYYVKPNNGKGQQRGFQNDERGKSRKLAAVRTMFAYFYKRRKLSRNPATLVDFPKIHEKNIIRLEINEVAQLLDEVESGNKLTEHQRKYHQYTKYRDLAIITLLLGTGMRVSECVGIDVKDIDFDSNGVKVTRKGGNESILYFGDEVREALQNYIPQRTAIRTMPQYENALFLSLQNRRITVRSVQLLVKKYSRLITTMKKISPHKLRSTYGTNLYKESGDIYLVADVLGHSDVNTTRRHYAQMEDERRRQAAKYVKLRRED